MYILNSLFQPRFCYDFLFFAVLMLESVFFSRKQSTHIGTSLTMLKSNINQVINNSYTQLTAISLQVKPNQPKRQRKIQMILYFLL